jgi:hypothetical protein
MGILAGELGQRVAFTQCCTIWTNVQRRCEAHNSWDPIHRSKVINRFVLAKMEVNADQDTTVSPLSVV